MGSRVTVLEMRSDWPGPRDHEAYYAPAIPRPAQSESAFVEDVIAERRDWGLPVDPDSVGLAIENSRRPGYPLPGIHWTPEELADDESFDGELADRAEALLIDAGAEVGSVALCWVDSRRGVAVSVKHEVERYRALLHRELGSDRVFVKPARYSARELRALSDRIAADAAGLRDLGIDVWSLTAGEDGVTVSYFAADRERSQRLIADRYGEMVIADWTGSSRLAEEPQSFGSWISDGTELTVFYALPHNGERPGNCTAEEGPDRVIVTLTILAPQGFRTLAGGATLSHATVTLDEPVADRDVIDAADDLPRPRWSRAGRCG